VLLAESDNGRRLALMVSIERARFSSFARPGDLISLSVDIEGLDADVARVRGAATVGERAVASARFSFKLVAPDTLIPAEFAPFWRRSMHTWMGRYPEPGP
jgi:3-hydroxymyristoyl/3-hydroxydecanoyl-(acyl carrier protein) dehydratase